MKSSPFMILLLTCLLLGGSGSWHMFDHTEVEIITEQSEKSLEESSEKKLEEQADINPGFAPFRSTLKMTVSSSDFYFFSYSKAVDIPPERRK